MWLSKIYGNALVSALGGPTSGDNRKMDLLSDTIKCALFTASSNAVSAAATIDTFSDVTNEVSATGYTAGGAPLGSKAISFTTTNRVFRFNAAGALWNAATLTTSRYAVVYDDTPTDKPVLGYVDLGSVFASLTLAEFFITWSTQGLFQLSPWSLTGWHWFSRAWENIFGGSGAGEARMTDWLSDTIKCSLHTSAMTITDSFETYSDLTNEVSGAGYTSGGETLTSKTIAYSAGAKTMTLDCADINFGASVTVSNARYAALYNDTATDKPLLGYCDLFANYSVSAAPLILAVDTDGLLTATHA